MKHLTGWQRIGVVISVCWMLVAASALYEYYKYTGIFDPWDPPMLMQHFRPLFGNFPPTTIRILATFGLPLVGVWLFAYAAILTTTWVEAGFQKNKHTSTITRARKTYLGIAAIFLLSLALFLWLPSGQFVQQLAGVPLVGSLVGALFQIIRDQAAHDRQMAILEAQNRFSLGASSHMANVAFDKHVAFSEEYAEEVHKVLRTLFRKGPTPEVLEHTRALYALQQKYTVWLTSKIEVDLELFESALRRIGANAQYLKNAHSAEDRPQRIAAMYKTFADVMGFEYMGASEWEGEGLSEELAISMVIQRLRAILGTEEFTKMRGAIVSKALSELRQGG